MFRKFLSGMAYGAGFGIALIVVVVIYFQYFFNPMFGGNHSLSNEAVDSPPAIDKKSRYLGSPAIYSGGFLDNKSGVLAEGPGIIAGNAALNNNPVSGLRLRLALNGSVFSHWVTTDDQGRYAVNVPYGEYKIDGFQLDTTTANALLAGKIDHPQNAHSSESFIVSNVEEGRGLNFKYVDPIEKMITKKKYSLSEDIVIKWASHPGASFYSIQIYEKHDPHVYAGSNTIFHWSKRPSVPGTSFNLKENGVELKSGHFYVVEIDARDELMGILSKSSRKLSGYDFEITE